MRRNLRLDWRALALLGALLSIIIDWPGLVYAMPTILPPLAAGATEVAPLDTLNTIKTDKMLNFFPAALKHPVANDRSDQNSEIKNELRGSQMRKEDVNNILTTSAMPPSRAMSLCGTETATATRQQTQHRITNRNEKQKEQQEHQFNETYNSISDEQVEITVIHAANEQQNSPNKEIINTTALLEASLFNTHTKNSTTNTISLSKSIDTQPTTTTTTTTTTTAITTESSAKIQSTLMSTTSVEHSYEQPRTAVKSDLNPKSLVNSFKLSSFHHVVILSRNGRSVPPVSPSARASSRNRTLVASVSNHGSSSRASRSSKAIGGGALVRRSSDVSVSKSKRLNSSRNFHPKNNLDRNERSTVSHLSGPSRKIQLYIKNRFIQLLPDGTVNGTEDEQCDYTILQRSTVEVGRIKIQGVATCLYLCMDPCGAVYGSKEFTDDCVFNESMEQHNYNTYSSTYNSNARRKYYLALNRHGEPRKLQIPPSRSLGKLATYTNAIPETVPQERVEQLIAKNFGANRVKHGIRQLCDTGKPLIELIDSKNFKARPKCNPNNNNSNSNSKNTLSRTVDTDSSLVSHSNNNGQVLNNVPVANDKNNLSYNSRSSSSSNSSSSSSSNSSSSSSNSRQEINSDSSSSPSSISISQSNGHISNSNSNSKQTNSSSDSLSSSSNTALQTGGHRGGKKPGKKRKCRRFENEEQHNCTTPLNRPTSFTKRGHQLGPMRQQKCRNLLLQQQQAGMVDIVLPPMCTKKGGPKKQHGNNRKGQGKNGLGTDGFGPNNRRGKKLNINRTTVGGSNHKQAAKNDSNNRNNNGNSKKKPKNSKRGGVNSANRKNNKKASNATTEKLTVAESTSTQTSSTSTLKPKSWETTSLMPSTTLFDNYDPHAEATSDRGDREQRNVRYSSSMEEYMEHSSEDSSATEDLDDDENDLENNDEINEDASYEDDSYVIPSSSQLPYSAAAEPAHKPLTAGSDDFLYYDQLDFDLKFTRSYGLPCPAPQRAEQTPDTSLRVI